MSLKIHSAEPINGLCNLMGSLGGPENPLGGGIWNFFFMESISIIKGATSVKKEAEKVQRQKSFFLYREKRREGLFAF